MSDNNRLKSEDETPGKAAAENSANIDRRAALKNIGALAGAAPAVAVLLTPSASRAACGSPGEACNGHVAPTWGSPGDGGAGGDSGLLGNGGRES